MHASQPTTPVVRGYGRRLLAWDVDEYPRHVRTRFWYIAGAVVSVCLIVYAIVTANFLFAVIILMIGIITLLSTFQEPDKIQIILTTTGLVVGDSYFDYKDVRDFSIVYDPPHVKLLYIDFHKALQPLISVPLEDIDPNRVREVLLTFCSENLGRTDETLTDVVRRLYKL